MGFIVGLIKGSAYCSKAQLFINTISGIRELTRSAAINTFFGESGNDERS
jgi:hypothetical protein